MISGVIVNLNESAKLESCLEGIKDLVGEIVMVDLGSTDDSFAVAQRYGAKVIKHSHVAYVEEVRDFAISRARGKWVLVLDPDERVQPGLADRLSRVAAEGNYQAVNIPRKNVFFGQWIKHTNFWPDRHLRFFQKGAVQWPRRIHAYPKVEGRVLALPAVESLALEHQSYDTYGQFIQRQRRYAQVEARNNLDAGVSLWRQLLWRPPREFLVRFIKYQGYLDGTNGVYLVFALVWYQLLVGLKMWEMRSK